MIEAGDERWGRIEAAFASAHELDARARATLLLTTFATEPELRQQVERLLAAHDAAGDFLTHLDRARSAALLQLTVDEEPVRVGRYRIVRRLGHGAMGVVYLAHDLDLDRPVALKLLRAPRGTARAQRQLLEEARAASALDHPNVAVVHEIGESEDGRAFIAMTYCEG
ncbi:MAG TPA: protein kinase, partial [Longimicrobiales bacterium]|nr:protein kinase [Longimicrobiales bacterium]